MEAFPWANTERLHSSGFNGVNSSICVLDP
jgi:hypothetical protein